MGGKDRAQAGRLYSSVGKCTPTLPPGSSEAVLPQIHITHLVTPLILLCRCCCCFTVRQACNLDDAVVRLSVALKLALLLEEAESGTGRASAPVQALHEARGVLAAAVRLAERFRCEAMAVHRGAADEHLRWITAARSQPSDQVAALVSGLCVCPSDCPGTWGWPEPPLVFPTRARAV